MRPGAPAPTLLGGQVATTSSDGTDHEER